jgi:hypothetical protein
MNDVAGTEIMTETADIMTGTTGGDERTTEAVKEIEIETITASETMTMSIAEKYTMNLKSTVEAKKTWTL